MEPVTEETEEIDIFIKCPRFGGTRNGLACAHYDRYRACRRTCESLAELIKKYEDFDGKVSSCFAERSSFMTSRSSCKFLPVEKESEFKCVGCGYLAKSARGMRSHITRSHKNQPWIKEQFESLMQGKKQEESTEPTCSEGSMITESL